MHGAHEFLTALTIVLGVAALTTVVFERLKQPVVLGYILAGVVIGPHLPVPLVASPDIVHSLSELGVIMLMFGLGLEFSLGKLFRAIPTAGVVAILQCSLMLWLGFLVARLFGWTLLESIFVGAVISISSTTIIAKAFDDEGIRGDLRQLVVAILIVEDLIAVLMMAVLTGISTGHGVSAEDLASTIGRLAVFLCALVAGGLFVVPRLMRAVVRLGRSETTVVATIGVCFGVSVLARELGYSVALGAFVAGMLVAESGKASQIEPLVHPIRDMFAAVFFVAVGMLIEPAAIAANWAAILVITGVVVGGKVLGVALGTFVTGRGIKVSISAGMSLAQIGEFSFIIAGLGVTLGVIGGHVYPVAVSVSAITTLLTPLLIRRSGRAASFVDRHLPKRLQTFVALYASWISRLRGSRGESLSKRRRFVRTVMLDVAVIAGTLITLSLSLDWLTAGLERTFALEHAAARVVVVAAGGVIVLPFCVSVLRTTYRFARLVSEAAVPRQTGSTLDLGHQPRVVLEASIRLVGVLIAGITLVAITQPFLPGFTAAIVLVIALVTLTIAFWRSMAGLQGHVRAASQAVLEALAAQSAASKSGSPDPMEEARRLFPGLGAPIRFELPQTSPAVGRSLAELELRAATGATVLALVRDGVGIAVPDAHDPLRPGDLLAVAGTAEAIAAAIALLEGRRG